MTHRKVTHRKALIIGTALIAFGLVVALLILFANFMADHDPHSVENLDKEAKAVCKKLDAEFVKVGDQRSCIRDGKTVWP